MAAPKQTDPQFKLRMTPEIKETIEKAASENNRSMNAEMLARLEWTFTAHPSAPLLRAMIDMQEKLLAGKIEVVVPRGLQVDVRRLADERGVSPQKFLISLLIEAMTQVDDQTDLGKELEARIMEFAKDGSVEFGDTTSS